MLNGYKTYIGLAIIGVAWAMNLLGWLPPEHADKLTQVGEFLTAVGAAHKVAKLEKK